jgi:general secretion pathway protein H
VKRARPDGFSLLELLVVVTIIAIFAGAAVLSLGSLGSDRDAQREVARLQGLVSLLREEAVMQSRDYGIYFSEIGYRFYIYDYQRLGWLQPTDDQFLAEHLLVESLQLALVLEDRDVRLTQDFEPTDRDEPLTPQVVLLASGEVTPFEAAFFRDFDGNRFILDVEFDGSLTVSEDAFGTR